MATDSVSIINSPRSPSSSSSPISDENATSPRIRRNPNKNNLSSPWANIVRGESESVPAAPSIPNKEQTLDLDSKMTNSPDGGDSHLEVSDTSNSNAVNKSSSSKKPAWNKPSNVVAAAVEVSPLMGAVTWPALSDSANAKSSPKSLSDSLKIDVSASPSQGPVVVASPQKPVSANSNPSLNNNNPNHQFPTRQKSFNKRGGSVAGGSANGAQSPTVEIPLNNNSTKTTTPLVPGTSPRGPHHKSHNWEGGQRTGMVSQPHTGNDHQQQRNSFRRGGGGNHRGDGPNHYSHGNRREQDRASHDSNTPHRGFNGRDGHMQQRVNQRNFVRPMQPSTAPFVSPPAIRPFGNPLGFPDMASPIYYFPTPAPETLRGVPFFHAAPFTMIVPAPDLQLRSVLAKQIEYYFSAENLCKDIYLRNYMDAQGWVPISVIANFNRVKQLANNIQFILDSVRTSTVVEVQGDKIRRRNDWMNWLLQQGQATSASDSLTAAANMLANYMQNVGVEEGNGANGNGKSPADAHTQGVLSRSSSEAVNDQQPKACNGEGQEKLQH